MPHSTADLPSQVAYTASLKSMASNQGYVGRLNSGGASSASLDNKWKRASMPVPDAYGDYKINYEGLRGRSGSVVSTASTAVLHRKSQHYEGTIAHALDKVIRDAPLIAELRTNVIIKDEYTLVTDLSYQLANRYSKAESTVMVNIEHSACLALAGTFDPCYVLTITTVPQHMSFTQNKRNASMIQTFMADILSVPPERGIVRFMSIPEENYATNGCTIAGEIERAERTAGMESMKRSLTDGKRPTPAYKRSHTDLERQKPNGIHTEERSEKEKRAERRRSMIVPAEYAPAEVFELDAGSERASSTKPHENGLRMNGISRDELAGKLSNGRPRSLAAPAAPATDTIEALPAIKPRHIAAVAKTDSQKAAHMPRTSKQESRPAKLQTSQSRANMNAATAPVTLKETIAENAKVLKSTDSESANTSKRRSTMTATSKGIPSPPPEPESKTPKVSKRKSFLAAFRR